MLLLFSAWHFENSRHARKCDDRRLLVSVAAAFYSYSVAEYDIAIYVTTNARRDSESRK